MHGLDGVDDRGRSKPSKKLTESRASGRSPEGSPDAKTVRWFRKQLLKWGQTHRRDFPWRRSRDPYGIFVAECLLQKTEANHALPVYRAFMARYPTLAALGDASLEELSALLEPLGLRFRAPRLLDAARSILENEAHGGQLPDCETELLKLPGVGRYTARSILSQAFDRPLAVLDTNIARILERFFGVEGGRVKSRDALLWSLAQEVAPKREMGVWNLTLIDFGAAVCTAQKPRCSECILLKRCNFGELRVESLDFRG
ncbi:A/G-specific adenine glycosylase [Oxynema aestuarii]|uniref:A/G-specific adenine glycosylase n=1 Tax=Oxynema aestuarii TaxID=2874213 RepID=UPI001FEC194F|nr:A/G-specific adenine glycosylase [Oxynema aestuarii]